MARFRHFLLAHCRLAALVLALALCVKAVIPAGYMIETDGDTISVGICGGQGGGAMLLAIPGRHGDHKSGPAPDQAQASAHCAFGVIGAPALGGADPWLLAALLAFVLLLSLSPSREPLLPEPVRERPPLRGPPARA